MTSPLPPSPTQLALTTIHAGTEVPLLDGSVTVAMADIINISILRDGEPTGQALQLTADEALTLAHGLTVQASRIIGNEPRNDGTKLGTIERLAKLQAAFSRAQR